MTLCLIECRKLECLQWMVWIVSWAQELELLERMDIFEYSREEQEFDILWDQGSVAQWIMYKWMMHKDALGQSFLERQSWGELKVPMFSEPCPQAGWHVPKLYDECSMQTDSHISVLFSVLHYTQVSSHKSTSFPLTIVYVDAPVWYTSHPFVVALCMFSVD